MVLGALGGVDVLIMRTVIQWKVLARVQQGGLENTAWKIN